jgi:hypothetical protein
VSRPESNFFEQWYFFRHRIVATGIEDVGVLRRRFPDLCLVQARGDQLPFRNRSFDVVFSNAVIEHVGPRRAQGRFVRELTRVGKQCFVGTPDRSFPVEMHSALPLVHYLPDRAFRLTLRVLGRADLANHECLNLLWARDLQRLCPCEARCRLLRVRVLGLSTNLALHIHSGHPDRGPH